MFADEKKNESHPVHGLHVHNRSRVGYVHIYTVQSIVLLYRLSNPYPLYAVYHLQPRLNDVEEPVVEVTKRVGGSRQEVETLARVS